MHPLDSPASLREALREIAGNLWFSWLADARAVFEELDPARFAALDHNPTALLAEVTDEELAAAAPRIVERVERVMDELAAERDRRTWWQRRQEDESFGVAYFSCEFGLDESLPIYSGGLGVLAGDHLKSASDLGVPLAAVGLFYRQGYFRQQLDAHDWQRERYPDNDPSRLPLTLEDVRPSVELADDDGVLTTVHAQVWRAQVGRTPLFLLDTDVDANPEWARRITDTLYGGDRRHRLRQELVLGVGGVRALRALGSEPTVFHMNEGHSAFLQLERLRELVEDQQIARDDALRRLRASTVFTTHTPVPAGNEIFDPALVEQNVAELVSRCGYSWDEFAALGRVEAADDSLRADTVRASHVVVRERRLRAARRGLPRAVAQGSGPSAGWTTSRSARSRTACTHAPGSRTVSTGCSAAKRTWAPPTSRARTRSTTMRCGTCIATQSSPSCASWGERGLRASFDPDALTIGFARRFATYKRADLLFSRPERLAALLSDAGRPLQIVLAGKAHPADEGGKELIQKVVAFARSEEAAGRVVFLPDYEMTLARYLVQGVDVWLNNPRRPLEASGTSGMKAALNGVVNCSVLDGWWCEGYSPDVGFPIGGEVVTGDDDAQDDADAEALYAVLEQQLVPAYYDDRARWVTLMRNSIAQLGARFNTNRMLVEYVDQLYLPAHRDLLSQLQTA